MKSSNIQPGVKATTKLNGRDQVVTVMGESIGNAKSGVTQWIVLTPAGNKVYRTARQLRDTAPKATRADGIDAVEDRAHEQAVKAHPVHRVKRWSGAQADETPICGAARLARCTAYTDAVTCPDCLRLQAERAG